MESLAVVILREVVCLFTDSICTAGNTVGIRTYDCTKEALARVIDIIIYVIVTQDDILIMSVFVRSPEGNYACTEIGNSTRKGYSRA